MQLDQNVTITLTVQEAEAILNALSQLPFREVNGLIHKIHQQATVQANQVNGADQTSSVEEQEKPEQPLAN